MRFTITRAANCLSEEPQPIEGAQPLSVDEKAPWIDQWTIEVPTLEALLALAQKSGHDLVVGLRGPLPRIIIYDGYLE